jgi:hypothetical protein
MPALRKKVKQTKSRARLDAFARGVIWGMHLGKLKREDMQKHLVKKDGTRPTLGCIDKVIGHKTADPAWRGEESRAGGRPYALSDKQKKLLVKFVFKHRGRVIVTVSYCRRKLKFLKKVGVSSVERALHGAGFCYAMLCEGGRVARKRSGAFWIVLERSGAFWGALERLCLL